MIITRKNIKIIPEPNKQLILISFYNSPEK